MPELRQTPLFRTTKALTNRDTVRSNKALPHFPAPKQGPLAILPSQGKAGTGAGQSLGSKGIELGFQNQRKKESIRVLSCRA